MKNICIVAMAFIMSVSCSRKINTAITHPAINQQAIGKGGNQILLGTCNREALLENPYKDWYTKNYDEYHIDSVTADQLKPYLASKRFDIFLGTWCGDSRREVPRMLKILDYCGVKQEKIRLIMVDNRDSSYKQSPTHEERGKDIRRVPDLLVYSQDKEINRIVESPVVSLEKDLLKIVQRMEYVPNYSKPK